LIIPPHEVQAFAAPLRERYAPESFARAPARITFLYPLVSPSEVNAASPPPGRLCSGVAAFDLTPGRYSRFVGALTLEPSDPLPVIALRRCLAAAFPDHRVHPGEHGSALHPHATLARFETPEAERAVVLPPAPSFTSTADRLRLYVRSSEASVPFTPKAVIPLWIRA
jgi:hypothetical protein